MITLCHPKSITGIILALGLSQFAHTPAEAADFGSIKSKPLIGNISAAPLILLTMQRDGRIFSEAYDNASDLNGDGVMDTKYKPAMQKYEDGNAQTDKSGKAVIIDYYGYFDSHKCYQYKNYSYRDASSAAQSVYAFVPIGDTDASKKCTAYTADTTTLTGPWSGDFLNYLTTTRLDALRKVLYGGKRYVDFAYNSTSTKSATVLERANVPQDTHAFGKEYTSEAVDGYKISDYTPLTAPATGKRHLFANVTLGKTSDNKPPLVRIVQNNDNRIWDWLNSEFNYVATNTINGGTVTPIDLNVRVVVCDSDQLPVTGDDKTFSYCKSYGSGTSISYKPVGVLHKYGEKDDIYFGLLTGSFKKNFSGGVLRKAISSFSNEINASTGEFVGKYSSDSASSKGIVFTIDRLQAMPFAGTGSAFNGTKGESNSSWTVGNPVAEMMYEGLRYFAGQGATSDYWDGTALDTDNLTGESPKLPAVLSWTNPYAGRNLCSKPTQMVISDVNPTFDSDKLPGSPWAGTFTPGSTDKFISLNVATLAGTIWTAEGLGTKNVIIGEKNGVATEVGMPTAKSSVSTFSGIRGLTPEDPMWQGSYYAAPVAKFGKETDLKTLGNSEFASSTITDRVVNTSAIALSSISPQIKIPYTDGSGKTTVVTVVPYAQTGNGSSWSFAELIKLYVDNVKNVTGAETDAAINNGDPYYKLHVVFSDNSLYTNYNQDNDMDARATYEVYLDKAHGQVVVNVCADPDPKSQTVGGKTSSTQAVRCNVDGKDGTGYSATGVKLMHLGYSISGVTINSGESVTRLVVRNNSFTATPTEQRHSLDIASAQVSGTFVDNYWNGTDANSSLTTYPVASDGYSLRLNNSTTYTITTSVAAGEFIPHDPLWYAAKYGGYSGNTPSLWARADGVTPKSYFKVTNPSLLRDQLDAALKQESDDSASGSAVAVNSQSASALTQVYQATYESKYWSGHLYAYPVSGGVAGTTSTWDAATGIPSASSRSIYTSRLGSTPLGIEFKWSSLDSTEKGLLASTEDYLDYLRGDRTNEGTGTSNYRVRDSATVLGDIVNSAPVFVGNEDLGYGTTLTGTVASEYTTFVSTTKSTRTQMLYVGANDGMLHAFAAADGKEKFAYIPRAILWGENASKLSDLVAKTYSHEFFVDGPSVAGDFYDGKDWKTALVGTLGAGGRAIFALDVSDPDNFSTSSVMWEFSHPELGYVRNSPLIARLPDDNWYVIVGNGLESNTCDKTKSVRYAATSVTAPLPTCTAMLSAQVRNSKLFIIKLKPDLSDGWTEGSDYYVLHATDEQTATTPPSITTTGTAPSITTTYLNGTDNGLAGPASLDGNLVSAKYIYAGDLQGNIWKFDLSDKDPTKWKTAYKVFQSKDAGGNTQPITTTVVAGSHPTTAGATCVSAGTGRFLYDGDLSYKGVQSAYGLIDSGSELDKGRATDLQQYTITKRQTEIGTNPTTGKQYTWNLVYVSNETFDATNKKGWFIDLREPSTVTPRDLGERIIYNPSQYKTRANELASTFTTIIPTSASACDVGGTTYTLDFNACTGEGLTSPPYDLNGDGVFDAHDQGTSADSSNRVGGIQGSGTNADGTTSSSEMCIPSGSIIPGCTNDIQMMSCTDPNHVPVTYTKSVAKKPTATSCGVSRTSWRQLR